jgi:flavin-dependent dehydrogenase
MAGQFSTIILGGGPAASATAIPLARAGHDVVILERSGFERRRVGETLPPSAKPHLCRLGAWETCRTDGHLASAGIVSVWGSVKPYESDFIFNPYGPGWQLDRRRFDERLAHLARQSGVRVYVGTRVTSCSPSDNGGWEVEAQAGQSTTRLRGRLLVDATGRGSWLARRLGVRRNSLDRLVGVVGNFPIPGGGAGDQRTVLEAAESGWWYSAMLPGERIAVAYMTDVDLLPPKPSDLDAFAGLQLRCTVQTRLRLPRGFRVEGFRAVSAASYCLDRVVGPNWIAVGDAAMAWDPLSGQGISKALETGLLASEALRQTLEGNRTALDEYERWVTAHFAGYLRARAHYYHAERRWPQSPFWQRRQRL